MTLSVEVEHLLINTTRWLPPKPFAFPVKKLSWCVVSFLAQMTSLPRPRNLPVRLTVVPRHFFLPFRRLRTRLPTFPPRRSPRVLVNLLVAAVLKWPTWTQLAPGRTTQDVLRSRTGTPLCPMAKHSRLLMLWCMTASPILELPGLCRWSTTLLASTPILVTVSLPMVMTWLLVRTFIPLEGLPSMGRTISRALLTTRNRMLTFLKPFRNGLPTPPILLVPPQAERGLSRVSTPTTVLLISPLLLIPLIQRPATVNLVTRSPCRVLPPGPRVRVAIVYTYTTTANSPPTTLTPTFNFPLPTFNSYLSWHEYVHASVAP